MTYPNITYYIYRGHPKTGDMIQIQNDDKVSFQPGCNEVRVDYSTDISLNKIEARVTFEGEEYGVGIGYLLAHDASVSANLQHHLTLLVTPEGFSRGDGLYRIGLYAQSAVDNAWNFTYYFVTMDGNNLVLQTNQAEEEITDLTNKSWIASETINVTSTFKFNIDFTDEIDYWTYIQSANIYDKKLERYINALIYGNAKTELIVYRQDLGWVHDSHLIIEITGGSLATLEALINYLCDNGDVVDTIMKVQAQGDYSSDVYREDGDTVNVLQADTLNQTGSMLEIN